MEWEEPCKLLLPLAHPLGQAVRKMFWDKADLGDVRVRAPQHAEEVYHRGEHLRLREWSPDDVADYEQRLREFEGVHVFVGGEGVEGAEEEEGEQAEEEEVEETEEEEGEEAEDEEGGENKEEARKAPVDIEPELNIPVDLNPPSQLPAPRPKPGPKGAGAVPPPKPAPKHGLALPPGALLDAPPNLPPWLPPQNLPLYARSLSRRTSTGGRRSWWRVRAMARSGRSRMCITSRGGGWTGDTP